MIIGKGWQSGNMLIVTFFHLMEYVMLSFILSFKTRQAGMARERGASKL